MTTFKPTPTPFELCQLALLIERNERAADQKLPGLYKRKSNDYYFRKAEDLFDQAAKFIEEGK